MRRKLQQPRPGAAGAPRAAAYVLFMCAPGGVFSRREVFWYLRISHTASFPAPRRLWKRSKTSKRIANAYGFCFPSVSCEAPRALEIAEGQVVRNSQVFNVERAAAPRKIRGCCRTGAAYIDTPVVWAAGSWRITCALGIANFPDKMISRSCNV